MLSKRGTLTVASRSVNGAILVRIQRLTPIPASRGILGLGNLFQSANKPEAPARRLQRRGWLGCWLELTPGLPAITLIKP
jgi:hypothetical protein